MCRNGGVGWLGLAADVVLVASKTVEESANIMWQPRFVKKFCYTPYDRDNGDSRKKISFLPIIRNTHLCKHKLMYVPIRLSGPIYIYIK